MANCYRCGVYLSPGEGYRRTVQTGSGTRFYFGKRMHSSYGFYYGTRTVCRACAEIIDKQNKIAAIILLCVAGAVLLFFFIILNTSTSKIDSVNTSTTSNSHYGDTKQLDLIGAEANVFSKPSVKSSVIATIIPSTTIKKVGETTYFVKIQFEKKGALTEGYVRKKDLVGYE